MFGLLRALNRLFNQSSSKPVSASPGGQPDTPQGLGICVDGIVVETDDPVMAAIVARAYASGNMVIGNRNDDGSCTINEIDVKEPQ